MDNSSVPSPFAVNQVGYQPEDSKQAFVSLTVQPGDSFVVLDARTQRLVYKSVIREGIRQDVATGDDIYILDFSDLTDPGTYQLRIPKYQAASDTFSVRSDVYDDVVHTALESFYYQRCGTGLESSRPWSHPVCHVDDAPFYENPEESRDVTGGWHDAGDYGKFSVNTAVSLGFLLYLYEHQPYKFQDGDLNVPGAGNGEPDLLDEARWALNWLMKMQRNDGAVFHKVQKKTWTGEYLPHEDPDNRYIYEVSSTATADLTAVAALGARIFRTFDYGYARKLEAAARRGWQYLATNPDMVPAGGFKNPPDVRGGEYGDHQDVDERLWAAVELYRLTNEPVFHRYFLENYEEVVDPKLPPVSWKNVAPFAIYSYLRNDSDRQDVSGRQNILKHVIQYAERLAQQGARSGYGVVLQSDEYYWGSNSVALGYAFTLIQAFELSRERHYRELALDQLHYILGRNPFGTSFVTGVGSRAVQHPYHQFSNELDVGQPVPGMVVGGPNNHSHLDKPLSEYPGRAYVDHQKNYMVNEVAINYTAPLVYVAGYFSHPKRIEDTVSSNKNR